MPLILLSFSVESDNDFSKIFRLFSVFIINGLKFRSIILHRSIENSIPKNLNMDVSSYLSRPI